MERVINYTYFFSHPPKTVWEYLTKPELMELWLMKNNFQPVIGHDFQFRTNPIPSLNFDGICYCKVLEVTPFTRLSYSWRCGPGEGKISLDSVVKWRLEEKDKGTEVFFEHSGFTKDEENLAYYKGFNHGWAEKFPQIEKLLNAK